eukprot:8887902-Pyramimonas_sp.AAC.1
MRRRPGFIIVLLPLKPKPIRVLSLSILDMRRNAELVRLGLDQLKYGALTRNLVRAIAAMELAPTSRWRPNLCSRSESAASH